MMQNGFRRIALAQGLLPARSPSGDVPVRAEASDAPPLNDAASPRTLVGLLDSDPERWVADAE
jgi:hypothetical protein